MMNFNFLIFFSIFVAVVVCKYDVFNNRSVELGYGEIAFFQTPGYPQLHNGSLFSLYNNTFYTRDSSENGTRCVMVFRGLSWFRTPFRNVQDIYYLYVSTFYLEQYHYIIEKYNAYQGYVFFEEIDNWCPFESISRDEPYLFNDETEIIAIAANYYNNSHDGGDLIIPNRKTGCKWQFAAPKGYGFKVVIKNYKIDPSIIFEIRNRTDLIVNDRSVKINHPFYNADDHIQINLLKADTVYETEMIFEAYVGVVKQNVKKIDGNCVLTKNEKLWTWTSNKNLTHGYKNSIFCHYNISVNAENTILAKVEQLSVEKFVDTFTYHDYENYFNLNYRDEVLLKPHKNGSEKMYFFEFNTDGNFEASGFNISFVENACRCSEQLLACDGHFHTAMMNTDYVCINLNCSYIIEPCPGNFSYLRINATNYMDQDLIKVLSNSSAVFDTRAFSLDSQIEVYLPSENENEMMLNVVSSGRKYTSFSVSTFELPQVDVHVILTLNDSIYVIDQTVVTLAVIEIEEDLKSKNVTVTVSGINKEECNKRFFEDETLSKQIVFKNCIVTNEFFECESSAETVYMYSNAILYPKDRLLSCFTAFALSTNKKHCVFNHTAYIVGGDKMTVSAMSAPDGECSLTMFKEFDNAYLLVNVFTTAINENVKILFGDQKKMFLEFNSRTANKWTNIVILSDVYFITVPKKAVVFLRFSVAKLPIIENVVQPPYNSMVTSPYYGSQICYFYDRGTFVTYNIGNVVVKFAVLEMNSENAFFVTNNSTIRITKVGQVFTFQNQSVSITLKHETKMNCGVLLYVKTIHNVVYTSVNYKIKWLICLVKATESSKRNTNNIFYCENFE